jgi:hypothetical protein
VEVGRTKGTPVFCDRNAWEADHIAVVGWVNAHPDFSGEIESGLFKMMAIGLGKQHGAENYHRAGQHYSYAEIFPLVGRTVLDRARGPRISRTARRDGHGRCSRDFGRERPLRGQGMSGFHQAITSHRRWAKHQQRRQGPWSSGDRRSRPAEQLIRLFVRDLTPESRKRDWKGA